MVQGPVFVTIQAADLSVSPTAIPLGRGNVVCTTTDSPSRNVPGFVQLPSGADPGDVIVVSNENIQVAVLPPSGETIRNAFGTPSGSVEVVANFGTFMNIGNSTWIYDD